MPDDNRFAGLGDAVDEPDGGSTDDQPSESAADTSGGGPAPGTATDDEGGPAFAFDATTQESIYVREETIEALDDAEFEVQARLRSDHDLRDLTGREFQDAVLRVAARQPDAVVEAILEAREG